MLCRVYRKPTTLCGYADPYRGSRLSDRIIASTIYQTEKVVSMKVGDEFSIADYRMKLTDIHDVEGGNWKAEEGVFQVFEGDDLTHGTSPAKTHLQRYPNSNDRIGDLFHQYGSYLFNHARSLP